MSFKHLARFLLCVGLYYSGAAAFARYMRLRSGRARVVILAYHSFSDVYQYLNMAISPAMFMRQIDTLQQTFDIKTLGGLLSSLQRHQAILTDTAVITVDDGYADNYAPLMQLMREQHIPSSVFLTTNHIDQQRPTTVMGLMLAIHHAQVTVLDLSTEDFGVFPIRSHAEKDAAIRAIDKVLRELPPDQQRAAVEHVFERCGVGADVRALAKQSMLTWQQAREMLEAGIEIGAHSRSHPVLSRLHPDAIRAEIRGSMRRVREKIGCGVVTFAYPYGGVDDINDEVIEACRQSGIACAVTLREQEIDSADRYALPRMMVTMDRCTAPWGSFSPAMWVCELEGLVDLFRGVSDANPGQVRPSALTRFKAFVGQALSVSSGVVLANLLDADFLQVLGQMAYRG